MRELTVAGLKRRRILLFCISLPVVLFVLFWAFKFLGLAPTAQSAIDAYDRGDYILSEDISTTLLDLNVVETWLPYFNRGVAYAGEAYYGPAIDDFEVALERAPVEKQCDIRLNLSLAWERFGDAYAEAGFAQGAIQLYQAAQAVLDDAGEECAPPESQQQVDESTDRVEQKIQNLQDQLDNQPPPTDGDDPRTEQERQLDELEQQQQQAAQEKADQEAEDRGQDSGGYSTDRPW